MQLPDEGVEPEEVWALDLPNEVARAVYQAQEASPAVFMFASAGALRDPTERCARTRS